jgi:hypothetical protein
MIKILLSGNNRSAISTFRLTVGFHERWKTAEIRPKNYPFLFIYYMSDTNISLRFSDLVVASCCVYEIRVIDFSLRNYVRSFNYLFLRLYMFRSYDHPQAEIYTSDINDTDNGSVVVRILVNLVANGRRILVKISHTNTTKHV